MTYNSISFFSGALGLDLGLDQAGITSLSYNENDKVICDTIQVNKPNVKLYSCDINALSATSILNDVKLKRGDVFLVCGGPPCQSFSTAGKRKSLSDDRGNAFLKFIDMIDGILPKYFVIENVRGIFSSKKDDRPGGALMFIYNSLQSLGYSVTFNLYDTSKFGVPQARERMVMIGSLNGSVPHLVPFKSPVRTFFDAQKGLQSAEYVQFSDKHLRYFKLLGPGQNWRNLPIALLEDAMGNALYSGGGRVGFYRRLAWDKPSPTLVTCPTMPATHLCHPTEDRPLSIEEYARIQTFPDDWKFLGTTKDKYRQIGNAVPVQFGKVIGEHLIAFDQKTLQIPIVLQPTSRYKCMDEVSWLAKYK